MSKKVSPDEFLNVVLHGQEPTKEIKEVKPRPKVSLTTGDPELDKAVRYIGKYIEIKTSIIECKMDRMLEFYMNHWLPVRQDGLIIYGLLSGVEECSLIKRSFGSEYASCGREQGNWIYLNFQEAYIDRMRPFAADLVNNFSTSWPHSSIQCDGVELKKIRVPWRNIDFIREVELQSTPLFRRTVSIAPIPSKYADTDGIDPQW